MYTVKRKITLESVQEEIANSLLEKFSKLYEAHDEAGLREFFAGLTEEQVSILNMMAEADISEENMINSIQPKTVKTTKIDINDFKKIYNDVEKLGPNRSLGTWPDKGDGYEAAEASRPQKTFEPTKSVNPVATSSAPTVKTTKIDINDFKKILNDVEKLGPNRSLGPWPYGSSYDYEASRPQKTFEPTKSVNPVATSSAPKAPSADKGPAGRPTGPGIRAAQDLPTPKAPTVPSYAMSNIPGFTSDSKTTAPLDKPKQGLSPNSPVWSKGTTPIPAINAPGTTRVDTSGQQAATSASRPLAPTASTASVRPAAPPVDNTSALERAAQPGKYAPPSPTDNSARANEYRAAKQGYWDKATGISESKTPSLEKFLREQNNGKKS